jgi:hemerythrin-like domain-containing protein
MLSSTPTCGARPLLPASPDSLEVLRSGHAGLDRQLEALEDLVSQVAEHGADERARGAAGELIAYFDAEAREHHRDEEEDLFPLLRERLAKDDRPEVGATLYELEREHAHMESLYSRLRDNLQAIAERGVTRLRTEDVAHFAWLYRRHMALEAKVVFPYAAEALKAADKSSLGERMAARRSADQITR